MNPLLLAGVLVGGVPVGDLAWSGAVGDLVALGALEESLGLELLGAALVGNVVVATAVGAGEETGGLEGLLQGLGSLQESRGLSRLESSVAAGATGLEGHEGSALDLVEGSDNAVELLEAEIGALGLLEVHLGLLEERDLLEGLVALLLGRARGDRLESEGGQGVVGVRQGAGIGVGSLDKGLEVGDGLLGLVGGVVDVSEHGVVLDIAGLNLQSLLQILVAALFVRWRSQY